METLYTMAHVILCRFVREHSHFPHPIYKSFGRCTYTTALASPVSLLTSQGTGYLPGYLIPRLLLQLLFDQPDLKTNFGSEIHNGGCADAVLDRCHGIHTVYRALYV